MPTKSISVNQVFKLPDATDIAALEMLLTDEQAADQWRKCEQGINAINNYFRDGVVARWRLGKYFLARKEEFPHGEWLKWLASEWAMIDVRTVQNFMRLANTKTLAFLLRASPEEIRRGYLSLMAPDNEPTKRAHPSQVMPEALAAVWLNPLTAWAERMKLRGGIGSLMDYQAEQLRAQTRDGYAILRELHEPKPVAVAEVITA